MKSNIICSGGLVDGETPNQESQYAHSMFLVQQRLARNIIVTLHTLWYSSRLRWYHFSSDPVRILKLGFERDVSCPNHACLHDAAIYLSLTLRRNDHTRSPNSTEDGWTHQLPFRLVRLLIHSSLSVTLTLHSGDSYTSVSFYPGRGHPRPSNPIGNPTFPGTNSLRQDEYQPSVV